MRLLKNQLQRKEDEFIRIEPDDDSNVRSTWISQKGNTLWAVGLIMALYASMVCFTRPLDFGDTIFYVSQILASGSHFQLDALRPLLDFGHLIWRPLGWLFFHAAEGVLPIAGLGGERVLLTKLLVLMSIISGAASTFLLHLICRNLGFAWTASFLVCVTFIFSNAVVYAASTGSSYMLALAFLTAALWLAMDCGRRQSEQAHWRLYCSGVLLALSAATWFPFCLAAPAVIAAAAISWTDIEPFSIHRFQVARAARVTSASIGGATIIFGIAALLLGIHSIAGVKSWVLTSAHGWRQSLNILRLGMGLPRCCVALSQDAGITWKRFLFHDPYAPVGPRELLEGNLVLLTVFYASLLLMLYTLLRSQRGRLFLLLLLIAALPVLAFAVFLFEPSSIERFMPIFPFYFVALGYQLHSVWPNLKQRSLALIYPLALILSSLIVYNNHSVEQHWVPTQARLELLKQQISPGSTIGLFANWDDIFQFTKDNPLHNNISESLVFWVVLRPANERIFCWRERFASRVLETWGTSNEFWVSERLLATVPLPEWDWVEGDDRAIRWAQVPGFFRQFQFDKKIGASDGFVRFAQTPMNRALLDHLVTQPCKPQAAEIQVDRSMFVVSASAPSSAVWPSTTGRAKNIPYCTLTNMRFVGGLGKATAMPGANSNAPIDGGEGRTRPLRSRVEGGATAEPAPFAGLVAAESWKFADVAATKPGSAFRVPVQFGHPDRVVAPPKIILFCPVKRDC
jgi:hypothetical protein